MPAYACILLRDSEFVTLAYEQSNLRFSGGFWNIWYIRIKRQCGVTSQDIPRTVAWRKPYPACKRMNRPRIVRLQLLALFALALMVLARVFSGPASPRGAVVLADIDRMELAQTSFEVERPVRLSVEATGSIEGGHRDGSTTPTLGAYGWIMRRDNRQVVWEMDGRDAVHERGTLVKVSDSIELEPGIYDAFFTSYGNTFFSYRDRSFFRRIFNPDQHWQNDRSKWQLVLRLLEGEENAVKKLRSEDFKASAPTPDGLIWTSGPAGSYETHRFIFEVVRPVTLRVYSIGEFDGEPKDYAWIERVTTGEHVWEMTEENTQPAGGADENRRFDGTIRVEPGVYRAFYQTDRTHAYRDWRANPPFDPAGWGLTLSVVNSSDLAAVGAFNPWENRTPIVRITEVPDDNMRSAQFVVKQPLDVLLCAVGEMHEGGRYDFAWIKNDQTAEHVWEMRYDQSEHAGGASKNRKVVEFLRLEPGSYTLYYQTDDSHAYGSWNADPPANPERWGVTMFPIARTVGNDVVEVIQPLNIITGKQADQSGLEGIQPPVPPVPPVAAIGQEVLVREVSLGNEAKVETSFELAESSTVTIYALGEITMRGRYDYGWLERADTGERVWEMTWQNTMPAGGDERNRRFFGQVSLPAGRYVVRFETDLSHAFNDFGDRAPADAEAWGITISR